MAERLTEMLGDAPDLPVSSRSRGVLEVAREEARALRHDYIGTEHLLLALADALPDMLVEQGVTPEQVRDALLRAVRPGRAAYAGELPFTSRAQALLRSASDFARLMECESIEPEHLLVAAATADRSIAQEILRMLGFDAQRGSISARERLAGGAADPAIPPGKGQLRVIMPELPLSDVAAGLAWYRDVLGFTVNYAQEDIAVMDRDSVRVLLIARTERHRGIGSCYVYVARVDDLYAELASRGVALPQAPVSQPWGLREFPVRDPEGNRITFGQPLW